MNTTSSNQGTEVRIIKGGPIKVTGKFTLTGTTGDLITPDSESSVYLCACGRSKSKPLCDGSHNK
jgi:CDGSH-type Zn-finger protein